MHIEKEADVTFTALMSIFCHLSALGMMNDLAKDSNAPLHLNHCILETSFHMILSNGGLWLVVPSGGNGVVADFVKDF